MSNPNTDRDERVRQIQERQARCLRADRDDVPQRTADPLARALARELRQAQTDRGYLLSLLDSQAAEDGEFDDAVDDAIAATAEVAALQVEAARLRQFCYEHGHTAEEHAKEIAESLNNAATRMRDRCVSELLVMKAEHIARGDLPLGRKVFDEATKRLSSLTLEQGEQEKSK